MIFAAGKGTRLGDLTKYCPKALVRVNGVPLLQFAIKNLIRFGFYEIIINIHHQGDHILQFLKEKNNFGIRIDISDERDELLDTGGGLRKASWFLEGEEPFLLYNVDVFTDLDLRDIYDFHVASGFIATLAVRHRNTARYLILDDHKFLCGWTNTKTDEIINSRDTGKRPEKVAFSGIQVLSPEILNLLPDKKVFPILEFYLNLASRYTIGTYSHDHTRWIDVGNPGTLKVAENIFPELSDRNTS